jgi:uncharacterized protein YbjQ (UPF0145 family)
LGIFDKLLGRDAVSAEESARAAQRSAETIAALRAGRLIPAVRERLAGARERKRPWIATLTPAELRIARSHGIRPITSVSGTCWLNYQFSWTRGHAEGWQLALMRMRAEAVEAGANAILDVKMRTIPLGVPNSMDFTLIGTAVRIESLPPTASPVVATVPALEFVKLLEADVVPTGIAVGASYQWLADYYNTAAQSFRWDNVEATQLSTLLAAVRDAAYRDLRYSARSQGNGVLAHVNFSQLFRREGEPSNPNRFLARHIVVATTVDAGPAVRVHHDVPFVLDLRADTPLAGTTTHHQSYAVNETEGAI